MVNYEQGKIIMAKVNPWGLQLCKKQAEKLHRQLLMDENVTISQSKVFFIKKTKSFVKNRFKD